ncbi:MAG TPA: helix-turn-helix transcriptional regulator [Pyrinomonadaceae bacterium]|jgi:predicted XRE-type DNA-binding protein
MEREIKAAKGESTEMKNAVCASSGNVFADLGFHDAEERLLKANLATQIAQLIGKKRWSQARAANRMALDEPNLSLILRGHLSGFSANRLLSILNSIESHL